MKTVRIILDAAGHGSIEIDGHKLSGVRACRFTAKAGEASFLLLEFVGYAVEIEGPADVIAGAQEQIVDVTAFESPFRAWVPVVRRNNGREGEGGSGSS